MQISTVLEWIGNDQTKRMEDARLFAATMSRHTSLDSTRTLPTAVRQSVAHRGLFRVRPLTSLIALTVVTAFCFPVGADQLQDLAKKAGIRILAEGESSSDSQKKTATAIPLKQMSATNRQRAQKIIEGCNQYRKLPTLQYSIDEPIYRYLLHHPDVAVSTWRVMGISRFEMWQTGPMEYEANAIDGSEGLADILYQDANQMVFICEGNYHNPLLLKPLEASALIWFRATYAPGAEGTHVVTQKADVFIRFPSPSLSTVAKMLTPVTNTMMDRNLFEVSLYASMMSRAVRDEPAWVVHVSDQLEGVLPQRKGELIEVARLPRKTGSKNLGRDERIMTVDRSVVMSPNLLFFDPPKEGAQIQTEMNPTSQGSVRTVEILPAKPVDAKTVSAPRVSSAGPAQGPPDTSAKVHSKSGVQQNTVGPADTNRSQSDDEFKLQPAVPPAGPTATGPAGSGTTLKTP